MPTTTLVERPSTMASTACPARIGEATPRTAASVASTRKATIVRRCGRANEATRRHVPVATAGRVPSSCMALCSADHIEKSLTTCRL